jgi:NADPH-dependent 7-cyano-7-deazaguanine reductase QueF
MGVKKCMVKLVVEESIEDKIRLKFEGFTSICPFTGSEDRTDFELSYTPGRFFNGSPVKIDLKRFQEKVASFEKTRIAMEVIPIEILKTCVEECVNQRKGRYAAPEEAEITSVSFEPSKGKDWGIRVSLKFEREVLQIERK